MLNLFIVFILFIIVYIMYKEGALSKKAFVSISILLLLIFGAVMSIPKTINTDNCEKTIAQDGFFRNKEKQEKKENETLEILNEAFNGFALWTIDRKTKTFNMNIVGEDYKKAIAFIIEYGRATADISRDWDNFIDTYIGSSETIKDMCGKGYTLSVLNPYNPDKSILMVRDGAVIYDVTRD